MTMSQANRAGTKEYYEAELKRLENSGLPNEVIAKVKAFLNHEQHGSNLSFYRLKFHANNLRHIFLGMTKEGLSEKILIPDVESIESALAYQKSRNVGVTDQPLNSKTNHTKRKGTLSGWYIEGYKSSLKKFYKWLEKGKYIDAVNWIKYDSNPNRKMKPDYIISQDQVDLLIRACDNSRDKAIISLLFDSGIRIGELITLRIRDVAWDTYGMKILVSGKTGVRNVRVIGDSVGFVRAWLNVHPDSFNEDAWLFCGIGHDIHSNDKTAQILSHSQIYASFNRIKKRAVKYGFPENTRINPHKFRHNVATRLAPKVSESILEKNMGWTLSSRMTRVYLHLNDETVDEAILKAHGIVKERESQNERKARLCMSCKTLNPSINSYCLQCGMPLDYGELEKMELREENVSETIGEFVTPDQKAMLRSLPKEAKLDVLATLLLDFESRGELDKIKNRVRKE